MRLPGTFFRFPYVLATAVALCMLGIGGFELWTSIRFGCFAITVGGTVTAQYPKVHYPIDTWKPLRRFGDQRLVDYSYDDVDGVRHHGTDQSPRRLLVPGDVVLVDYLEGTPDVSTLRPTFGWYFFMAVGLGFIFLGFLLLRIPLHARRRQSKADEWAEFLREKRST